MTQKAEAPSVREDLIEQAVQAALDAGLAVNGEHGVAAARHAARFVVAHVSPPSPAHGAVEALREAEAAAHWEGAYDRMSARNLTLSNALTLAVNTLDDLASGTGLSRPIEQIIRELNDCASSGGSALAQPAAQEGWRLVPVKPTEEMIGAGDEVMYGRYGCSFEVSPIYKAMLAAAPSKGVE